MNFPLTEHHALAAGMISDQEYNDGILAVEALARAQAAFLDAVVKFNSAQNVHNIDEATIDAVFHDEIPDAAWMIQQIEDARNGL